jgi:hypothetical protein
MASSQPVVGEPVVGPLPGSGDHPCHQDLDRELIGHQWGGETTERHTDDHQLAPVTDGPDDGVGVLAEPSRVVVAGQVGAPQNLMSPLTELPLHEVPTPPTSPKPLINANVAMTLDPVGSVLAHTVERHDLRGCHPHERAKRLVSEAHEVLDAVGTVVAFRDLGRDAVDVVGAAGQLCCAFDHHEGERRSLVVDHQGHSRVTLQGPTFGRGFVGQEEHIVVLEYETHWNGVRATVGSGRREDRGARPARQEGATCLGSHLISHCHLLYLSPHVRTCRHG